jgi:hypothetical protein
MTFDRPVVLDACVLVAAGLRDTLLRLAETPGLYAPRWSDDIMVEVERTLQGRFNKSPAQTLHLGARTSAVLSRSVGVRLRTSYAAPAKS